MNQYLLSTYAVDGEVPGAPKTPKEMQTFMERVMALEAEMDVLSLRPDPGEVPDAASLRQRVRDPAPARPDRLRRARDR